MIQVPEMAVIYSHRNFSTYLNCSVVHWGLRSALPGECYPGNTRAVANVEVTLTAGDAHQVVHQISLIDCRAVHRIRRRSDPVWLLPS